MFYEVYFSYKAGGKSHYLRTDSRRVVAARLNELLLQETEIRDTAERVIMKRGKTVILDMPTSASDEQILNAVRYPAVGQPRRIDSAVTLSVYLPKKASEYLKALGNGSASKGLRELLLTAGGEEMAQAYLVDR